MSKIASICKRRQQDIKEAEQDLQWIVADIAVRKSVFCLIHHNVLLWTRCTFLQRKANIVTSIDSATPSSIHLAPFILIGAESHASDKVKRECHVPTDSKVLQTCVHEAVRWFSLTQTYFRLCFRRWGWHTFWMLQHNANVIFPTPRSSSICTSRSMTVLARILERYV